MKKYLKLIFISNLYFFINKIAIAAAATGKADVYKVTMRKG